MLTTKHRKFVRKILNNRHLLLKENSRWIEKKSLIMMGIAKECTKLLTDAITVMRGKVSEFQLNIVRMGVMQPICHKAAGMSR